MKLSAFWFGFLLCLSIVIIPVAFILGDAERGYNALGGEAFTLALPFLVLQWRIWTVEQIKRNKRKEVK